MHTQMIVPFDDIPIPVDIAALPKADLHIHAEADARIERVLARRAGHAPYDWRNWSAQTMATIPPGIQRLMEWETNRRLDHQTIETLDADPELFVERIVDLLEEGAGDGAILIEVLFGSATVLRPDFMALFREAERRARLHYPRLRAEALLAAGTSSVWEERILPKCLAAACDGLAGIHIIPDPYDTEADWTLVYRWAEQVSAAGLGIAAHAGEFSAANIEAALRVPGLTRLGHAVYAATDPRLLDQIAERGVTIESNLTCNVVLGAVDSYEVYPLREFIAAGIPITINTDDPMRLGTTIGREYTIAAMLGFTQAELLSFTHNAVQASFLPIERKKTLLEEIS